MITPKRLFYTLLIIAFASACVLGNALFVGASENKIWDGSVSSSFSSGSGTENDPYVIKTPAELEFFAKSVNNGNSYKNKYIKLGGDIVLNDESFVLDPDSGLVKVSDNVNTAWIGTGICGDKSGENNLFDDTTSICGAVYKSDLTGERAAYQGTIYEHTPIGKSLYPFSGIFDGGGYTVSGIYINSSYKNDRGLFGCTDGAKIYNVNVKNSYIYGNSRVGAIGGSISFSSVSGCSSSANLFATSDVGGLIGYASDTAVSVCCNSGTVVGTDKVGGIVGVSVGNVSDTYNIGAVYAKSMAGGIVGQNLGSVSRSYNAAKIVASSNFGAIAGHSSTSPTNTFYMIGSIGEDDGGMSESQMQCQSSFYGFDFANVWTLDMGTGYPYPTLRLVSCEDHIHLFSNDCDSTCNNCDFKRTVTHDFGNQLQMDDVAHYLVCDVCGALENVDPHEYDDACDSICNVCSYDRNVFHDFSSAWCCDKSCHWHECSKCGRKIDEQSHTPGKEATEQSAQTCKICSYVIVPALGHKHSYDGKWISSDEGHYKECDCGEIGELFEHRWNSGTLTKFPTEDTPGVMTYKCDICSRTKVQYVEDIKDVISPDESENSNGNSAGGDGGESDDLIENNIYPSDTKEKDISLALSIGAIAVGFLNFAVIIVLIVILVKKNKGGKND